MRWEARVTEMEAFVILLLGFVSSYGNSLMTDNY